MNQQVESVIEINGLATRFGETLVHKDINLKINRGEIFAIVGGSGSGKTTLLREILLLQKPIKGSIHILGVDALKAEFNKTQALRRRFGVMFQQGALFSSLTVLQNISFPLREFTQLPAAFIRKLALLKLRLVGLEDDVGQRYPSELSGGMVKRVAIARALAMDPELLFLDEPTAGLDPESAAGIDDLVLELKATLGITIVMVTHDLDTLYKVPDRLAFLGLGEVLATGPLNALVKTTHPMVQNYFSGSRNRLKGEACGNAS